MPKQKQGDRVREKVTLFKTPVGVQVLESLNVPGIEKSSELRVLIELGFACRRAGFMLVGSTLRYGGRDWDGLSGLVSLAATATSDTASRVPTPGLPSQSMVPATPAFEAPGADTPRWDNATSHVPRDRDPVMESGEAPSSLLQSLRSL
jgi:hypothetical protein